METPKRKTKTKMGTKAVIHMEVRTWEETDGETFLLGDPHEVRREGGKNALWFLFH
jgi:hypothetical protein